MSWQIIHTRKFLCHRVRNSTSLVKKIAEDSAAAAKLTILVREEMNSLLCVQLPWAIIRLFSYLICRNYMNYFNTWW